MTNKTPDPQGSVSSTEFGAWQPIETAPQDGTKVLGYFTINGMSFIGVIWWIKDIHKEDEVHWRMALDNSSTRGYASSLRNDGATHWMPLPPPPTPQMSRLRSARLQSWAEAQEKAMLTRTHGAGIKVRCENWYWARKVQMLLSEAIGARWCNGLPIPWNTRRLRMIVEWSTHARCWLISWAIAPDFEACPMPEWSAKALIAAYHGSKLPNTTAEQPARAGEQR